MLTFLQNAYKLNVKGNLMQGNASNSYLCCLHRLWPKNLIITRAPPKSFRSHNFFFRFFSPQGIQLLTLLVPILIGFLLDAHTLKTSSKYTCQLHEHALQWLMRIGPKYPVEFKALMGQSTELRTKLETAVRQNQQSTNDKLKSESNTAARNQLNQPKPTIELKTNFSNFSSS